MSRKRERIDIICDMLTSITDKGGRIKPTHLMYKANLAHRQLVTYLDELIDKKLVEKTSEKNHEYILITEGGMRFLQKIKEMRDFEKTMGF